MPEVQQYYEVVFYNLNVAFDVDDEMCNIETRPSENKRMLLVASSQSKLPNHGEMMCDDLASAIIWCNRCAKLHVI